MRALTLIAALLVACGNGNSGTHDAGGDGSGSGGDAADAMIDADPNVRGTVTVRIIDKNGAPVAGMYVVFIDTDATVTERTTDAAGMAQLDVYPNASVTAVRSRGMTYSITTVQALNPGDLVTLISAASNVSVSEDAFSQRQVPIPSADIAASPTGATKSGATATFTTVAPHGLVVGDRVIVSDVAVVGYNGTWTVSGTPSTTTFTANLGSGGLTNSGSGAIGATATKAVPFTVNFSAYAGAERYEVRTRCGNVDVGTATAPEVALPAYCTAATMDFEVFAKTNAGAVLAWTERANVAFAAGGNTTITDTWHARSQLTATYTNPTAMVTDIEIQRFSPHARGIPVATAAGAATSSTVLSVDASKPAKAMIATQLTCPSGASSSCISTGGGVARQTVTEVVDGSAATYALDIGANLLPWVKGLYVPQTTTLEVTTTGSSAYDLFEGNLRYTRGQVIYTWRVFGPIAQNVTFPALPATAPGDPTILPSDIMSNYQVFVGESDAINGYRDAIKSVYEALGTAEASPNPNTRIYGGAKNRISRWN